MLNVALPEQLEKLSDQLALATDFIKSVPSDVYSTRQKDWLLVVARRCTEFAEAYEAQV